MCRISSSFAFYYLFKKEFLGCEALEFFSLLQNFFSLLQTDRFLTANGSFAYWKRIVSLLEKNFSLLQILLSWAKKSMKKRCRTNMH